VPVSIQRTAHDHYELTLHPPITNLGGNIEADTQHINAVMEALVRGRAEHYMWAQPRFATRPAGLPPVYSDAALAAVGRQPSRMA
jgi:lauroyl/myristoyl acyltransferase